MMGSKYPLFEKLLKLPSKKELEKSTFVDYQDTTINTNTLDLSNLKLPEIKLKKNTYMNKMQWYGFIFHRCHNDHYINKNQCTLFDLIYQGKQELWLKRPLPITCDLCNVDYLDYKSYYDHCKLAKHCEQICRFYGDGELPKKFWNNDLLTTTHHKINEHDHILKKNLKFLKIPKKQLITLFTLLQSPLFIPKELSQTIIYDYLLGPHFLKCIQFIQTFCKQKTQNLDLPTIIQFLDRMSISEYQTNGIYGNLCCIRTRLLYGWTPYDIKLELFNIPMARPSRRSDFNNTTQITD